MRAARELKKMRQHDSIITTCPRLGAARGGDGASARPRRLRVLLVVESAAGGTGRHVLDLVGGLAARGCEVHLLYSPLRMDSLFAERLTQLVRDTGVTCATIRARSSIHPSDLSAALQVRRYLRKHGPFDLIHGHSSKGGALARLAAVGAGCRAVYTPHGLVTADPSVPLPKRLLYLVMEVALSRLTKRIITVSPEEHRSAARSGLGRRRMSVVPNGVDAGPDVTQAEARRRLGLPEDAVVVGFVGRLVGVKSPHMLIEAFADAAASVPAARLVLIGDGPLMNPIRELAAKLGAADRVLFLGQCDARELYPAFDVFAICSRKEGLPYVVLEAMAAGLPVAATASAGVELLVEAGVNGEVVPRDDTSAFAEALRRLLSDASLRSRYATGARQRAARFTVSRMVEETLAVYRGVVGAGFLQDVVDTDAPPGHFAEPDVDTEGALEVIA
jgi:glycosyltransferase involved in cell wall biosynthesis